MKIKLLVFIISMLVLTAVPSFSGDISFNFYRESKAGGEAEKVYGFMYMRIFPDDKDNSVYIHVTAPVNQIIEYKGLTTVIYYPDDKQAIVFESKKEQPKINPMDPAVKKIDFSAAGFILAKKEKTGDGKKETWVPKDRALAPLKEIILGTLTDGAVTLIEIKGKDGKIMSRMKYADFMDVIGKKIPLTVETYSATGGSDEYQQTKLTKPDSKSALPGIIKNFKIPAGTEIQNVKI